MGETAQHPAAALPDDDCAGAILTIDLDAVKSNYAYLNAQTADAVRCAAVVKADAYGLGAARVVPALYDAGCRFFYVACLDEALAFPGFFDTFPNDITVAVFDGLLPFSAFDAPGWILPVINTPDGLYKQAEKAGRLGRALPAILHVDTGMNRLGVSMRELDDILSDGVPDGVRIVQVMSHLACAEEQGRDMNERQLGRMRDVAARFPDARACFANSSGIFLGSEYHFDMVRPGCSLYGINPVPARDNPMRQPVTLEARVLQIRDAEQGETVGYGATHGFDAPAKLATLSLGYADGYLRCLSDRGRAFVGEQAVPVVGRVSMDLISVDITGISGTNLKVGDMVEILGAHQTADDIADDADTIGYEVLTSLGQRYRRRYTG